MQDISTGGSSSVAMNEWENAAQIIYVNDACLYADK